MATFASGQITITDLYDAPSVYSWISASQATAQTYNNTASTYSPNYPTTPQALTLNLTKAGSTVSLLGADVSNVKWKKTVGNVTTEITSTTSTDVEYKSGSANSVLTTKVNIPVANNAVIWTVEGTWKDPVTSMPVAFSATISLTLVQLAKASVTPNVYTPNGDFFRNNLPASLTINADLYKDGAISTGSKKIKWFASDSSVSTSQDADGGVGWRKITATTGSVGEVANSGFDVAVATQGVLTVYPEAVINGQTYKVVITDNVGGTAGTKVTQYTTLKDMDDPIMLVVESTGGNVIKNGAGSTTLSARLFRNGEEIDAGGTLYAYKWTKWQNNVMVKNFGGTGVAFKTGKTLAVGSADVNLNTTFKAEAGDK